MAADFTSNKVTASKYEGIRFIYTGNLASPAPVTYLWDFGDGNVSNEMEPVYYYKETGSYTVSLRVEYDDTSTSTEEKTDYVTINSDVEDEYDDLLLTQFKESISLKKLLNIFVNRGTLVNTQSDLLLDVRSIDDDNVSAFLDDIGDIVGLARDSRTDVDYVDVLAQMPVVNMSHGQLEALIKYTHLFIEPDNLIALEGTGVVLLNIIDSGSHNYALFKQRAELVAAGGVRVMVAVSSGAEVPLEFVYTSEPGIYSNSGLSEYGGSFTGGQLLELY